MKDMMRCFNRYGQHVGNDNRNAIKRRQTKKGMQVACGLITFFIFHLSFGISACSSIDCPVQNTVSTHYAICDADGNETTLNDTLWVWTQRSDGTDTLLLNRLIGQSAFSLPISYSHPEDMLVFFKGDINGNYTLDTLWLKKDDIPHFESVDCSAHFFHQLTGTRYTRNGIDSITIIDHV